MMDAERPPSPVRLVELQIRNLRNIRYLELRPDAPLLVVTGGNGAGKTTLLEAVYLLARGRTFRGRKSGALIAQGSPRTAIQAEIATDRNLFGARHRIEFQRDRLGTGWRIDGHPGNLASTGAEALFTVKLVGENAQKLLGDDPSLRRTFLDWNRFQTDDGFGRLRRDFTRILQQRNAALRANTGDLPAWDAALADAGERLTAGREEFFRAWREHFLRIAAEFHFLAECDLWFNRGWSVAHPLLEALVASRDEDRARGYTLLGPSRADFGLAGAAGAWIPSRGQAKAAVALLQVAAEWVHRGCGLGPATWLLDDLEAEIDAELLRMVWSRFVATESPCLVTRVSDQLDPGCFDHAGQALMFHVKHGQLMFHGVRM